MIISLNFYLLGNFACFFFFFFFFLSSDFFQNQHFGKILSGIPSECQTVWIQIRPGILSGLIWLQTVCKAYQQTAKVTASKERVKQISELFQKKKKLKSEAQSALIMSDAILYI